MGEQPADGVILNVASVQAEMDIAQMAAYNAAKAAVVQLSRTLAVEFVEHAVRVNAILLGGVETWARRRSGPGWPTASGRPETVRPPSRSPRRAGAPPSCGAWNRIASPPPSSHWPARAPRSSRAPP
jgi:NAD(P)-dependent dehydrogenase (short-subunit alcohol dehydrogenase family)